MIRSNALYILLALSFSCVALSQRTYYVKNGGNDNLDGRSDGNAWATVTKVNSYQGSLAPGDNILFKRGNTWREVLVLTQSGTASSPITYGAYGSGAKPLLMGSIDLSSTGRWTNYSGNIWKSTNPFYGFSHARGDCSGLWFNNVDSVGILKFNYSECVKQGNFYTSTDGSNVLYLYSSGNPGSYYSHIEAIAANDETDLISISGNYVTVQNIQCEYGSGIKIGANSSHNVIIEHVDLMRSGAQRFTGMSGTDRAGGGIWMWNGSTDMTVRYCYISQQYDGGISPQGDGSSSGNFKRLYFHHNIIKNCTYGFELWTRGGCNLDSMFIENNTMINSGGWGNVQEQRPQSPNRFPDPWCGLGRGDLLDFHSISATWTHIYVRNNIFYQNQADRCIYLPDDASSAISGMTFDHNLYYHPSGTMIAWPKSQTYTQAQFSTFQSATGNDANSKTGNPLFVSAIDFHLQANSPGIGAGAHVGYTQDFDGNAIADVPGVGACEYGTDNAKTGIDQSKGSLPTEFKLNQNFPNPFNPTTIIRFGLPFAAQVSLRVFNTIGQEVATLVDEQKSAGSYDVTFNAKGLASNVYFYRLEVQSIEGGQARNLIATKKLVLLK